MFLGKIIYSAYLQQIVKGEMEAPFENATRHERINYGTSDRSQVRVRDCVEVRLFNPSAYAFEYHNPHLSRTYSLLFN